MLSEICRYKAAFLADRPVETHQLTLSDASLNTRWEAIQRVRPQARREKTANDQENGKMMVGFPACWVVISTISFIYLNNKV
jgi:hypothetical protein